MTKKWIIGFVVLSISACGNPRSTVDVARKDQKKLVGENTRKKTTNLLGDQGTIDPTVTPDTIDPKLPAEVPAAPETENKKSEPTTEVTSLTDKIAERKEQAEAGVNAKDAMNSEALAQLQPVTVLTQKDVGNLGLSRVVPSRKLDEVNKAGKSVVSWKDAEPILHNLDEEFTTYSSIDPSLWTNDDLAQVQDYLDFLVPVENNAQGPFKQELLAATKDKREKFSALAGLMAWSTMPAFIRFHRCWRWPRRSGMP